MSQIPTNRCTIDIHWKIIHASCSAALSFVCSLRPATAALIRILFPLPHFARAACSKTELQESFSNLRLERIAKHKSFLENRA